MRWTVLVAFACLPPLAFAGGEPWADEPAFKALVGKEVETLERLMDTAVEKDYRRQAWYLAERILTVAPVHARGAETLDKWQPTELQAGKEPKKTFLAKVAGELKELGDQYFHFGETLEASGMDPLAYYPINVRAHAYGSEAGPLVGSLRGAGYVVLGVYEPKPQSEVERYLGGPIGAFRFPPEFDDAYLHARVVWPEARGVEWDAWRLLSDHDWKEALRLIGMLALADRWFAKTFGSKAPRKVERTTNVMVFSEYQKYDRIGGDLVAEADRARFEATSGWYDVAARRLMVCWRHRMNGWLGDDDLMLGHAAQVMARRHLAGDAPGAVTGRGAWLLEGLRGALEGFGRDADGEGEIVPAACWRLAVARTLRERGELMAWDEFLALDAAAMAQRTRVDLPIDFGGTQRDGQQIDVVAAQATALVVGIMKADKGKGARRLAKALATLIKKGALPDPAKALGWKADRLAAEAERAMDAR
jgi:hypothetical protein